MELKRYFLLGSALVEPEQAAQVSGTEESA